MDAERGDDTERAGSLWARPRADAPPEWPDEDAAPVWLPPSPDPPGEGAEAAASEGLADAGWWYRLLAFSVDVVLAIVIAVILTLVLIAFAGSADASVDAYTALVVVAFVAGWVVVTSWATSRTGGQSIGKWIGGMRVVRDDGRPATFGSSLLRDLVFRIPYVIPAYALIDGLLAAGAERKALHDRMAGTRVVRLPGYRRRLVPLLVAAGVAAAAWVAIVAVGSDTGGGGYTRGEFVSDCAGGAYDGSRCNCIYDAMVREFGRETVDRLESIGGADRKLILEASNTLHPC
jgi:uncharacterized RDD family membrane protein YckC